MNIKNLKVSAQLILGFISILVLIIAFGVVSYRHANRIQHEMETIYNHPLKVRVAIGKLQADILKMRLGNRDLMLANSNKEQQAAIMMMEFAEYDAQKQFDVIKNNFVGSQAEVDSAYADFMCWKIAREENTRLAIAGNIEQVKENVKVNGIVGVYRERMIKHISNIDQYATNKAVSLFDEAHKLSDTLTATLILGILFVFIISLSIIFILLRNIRRPIKELISAADRFNDGDLSARSISDHENEFGKLSSSFNSMVEKIQTERNLSDKTETLTNAMLSVDNSHKFFRELLPVIAQLTNSQMAAVYLLAEDKEHYEHYESVGMTPEAANYVFSATGLHGEFGAVLSSHKIEYIRKIPHDTQFIFQSVSGKIIPREIITIPILAANEVVAIISLGSVRKYSDEANQLVDRIFDILTARVEGILTYRKMRKYSKQLVTQNDELETQRNEMEQQSIELSEQNRELEIQKNQLHEASRLKTNFLSNMSHELRTPLNSVIALSGVLNRRLAKQIPDEEYSYLEVIERNGKHLLSLINDILDISRIEAGREEIEVTKFNPNNLVEEIVSMIKQQAVQKNIDLVHKISNPELYLTSDSDKCRHILQNLISNAVKFTDIGTVEVSVFPDGNNLKFRVSDTGIGISAQNINHIFEEFRQADGSTSRRFGGTGLGLAIAKKYTNLLGGTISVESVPDKGSVFTVTLPLNYTSENKLSEPVQIPVVSTRLNKPNYATPHRPSLNKTILMVEDSEPAIIQMKDFLEESGYTVLTAINGATAIEIIPVAKPDAIILDLMMPEVDGFQVLRTIRDAELTAHIPVLILTAKHITKDDLALLKQNNVHQLIQKGDVNKNELLNAVAAMVSVKQDNVEEVKPVTQKTQKLPSISGKPTVLVVEDNPDNMITVKAVLADKFNVLEAIDGYDGIAMAQLHKPNLILMDIALPGLDGIEAFKSIRKTMDLQHIPIIALTASAMTTDREAILSHGFDAYLVKPIDEKIFFKTINNVLFGK
jgi:signal transduction histidine kinase/CheY-like chemotaxis protein/HAMP domain-containing protein